LTHITMIITFSIANFRSFNEEVTFSMVASNRFSGSHENHLVSIPNSEASVLRAGVIYGANGAGKSNFFKALKFLRTTRPVWSFTLATLSPSCTTWA